jgi:hypothetical protein
MPEVTLHMHVCGTQVLQPQVEAICVVSLCRRCGCGCGGAIHRFGISGFQKRHRYFPVSITTKIFGKMSIIRTI